LHTPRAPRRRSHTRARPPRCGRKGRPGRYLIVNADDLGADDGTTRGIIEAHERGIVTSASLMVDMPGARTAVRAARAHPRLGVGLHVSFTAGRPLADLADLGRLRQELERQVDRFTELTGQDPTHIDSHHHVHLRPEVAPLFVELCRNRRIPLRSFSGITYVGNFYAQWEPGQTDLGHISPEYLISLLQDIAPGFSELACHPGDRDARFDPLYDWQRRFEVAALTDPRVSAVATREAIRLIDYREYRRLASVSSTRVASYSTT
jgi:chitin disaccharide deacetylase